VTVNASSCHVCHKRVKGDRIGINGHIMDFKKAVPCKKDWAVWMGTMGLFALDPSGNSSLAHPCTLFSPWLCICCHGLLVLVFLIEVCNQIAPFRASIFLSLYQQLGFGVNARGRTGGGEANGHQ
jgi:hypothetical protein